MSGGELEVLEDTASLLYSALKTVMEREECYYAHEPEEKPTPCYCPHCVAAATLRTVQNWRFRCSRESRLEHNPRERKLVEAWKSYPANDRLLAAILGQEGTAPSIRDWFVATSIIRWLGTNCGMSILDKAGWKYQGWDEDRAERKDSLGL
jgi:hypothetical protein